MKKIRHSMAVLTHFTEMRTRGWVVAFIAAAMFISELRAADSLKLTENGRVTAEVVVADDAPRPVKFAKAELEKYLAILATNACGEAKVKGGGEAKVKGEGEQRKVKVFISTLSSQPSTLNSQLRDDGFVITAKPDSIEIVGANPRGALYGAYEILKRFGGIRWLAPDTDGEYFTLKGDVVVPCGTIVENPRFKVRAVTGYGCDRRFLEWITRNNLTTCIAAETFVHDGKRTKLCDMLEDLAVYGCGSGGHIICELLYGEFKWEDRKARLERYAKSFKEHPNWWPVIDGKRKQGYYNPCLQDPAMFDHMASVYLKELDNPHAFDEPVIIGNNDTTVWCECEKCRAMDDPKMVGTTGQLSNRYWYMVNEIAKRIWKVRPEAKLGGWAYQNFWYPPTTTKLDPRLGVYISYNSQCWRHSVADPNCSVNREMRKIYEAWKKIGKLAIWNRSEVQAGAGPGCFSPSERVLYNNYREYGLLGCDGDKIWVYAPYPEHMNWLKAENGDGWNFSFWAMWRTCWLSGQFMWNPDRDYDALYDECCRLYYGAAWEGGMREFRHLLEEAFYHTKGCYGYSQHNPLGMCLDWPADAEARLVALMDRAVASARASGDARAILHVGRDQEIFKRTWLASRKEFLSSYRAFASRKRTGAIKIDGVLDEADWQKTETLGDFRYPIWETADDLAGKTAKEQTNVRVLWDDENLYVGFEVLESNMAGVIAQPAAKVDRNAGWGALGDHVELFYHTPQMGEKAYLLNFNSEGAILDGIKKSATVFDGTFDSRVKYAVTKKSDRWFVEMAIPADEIGGRPAEGETWRLNACRGRKNKAQREGDPTSLTSANGRFYAPSCFVYLNFVR